jgi:putative Holliday junction resolvase
MRVAGIDLGTVRVGLAMSDELGFLAHVRPCLDGRDTGRLVDQLCRLVPEEGIERFVVGLPKTLAGHEGPAARRARQFARRLAAQSRIPVELWDERWSTREAQARLRDQGLGTREARSRVDSAAAAVILQAWLDKKRSARLPEPEADG